MIRDLSEVVFDCAANLSCATRLLAAEVRFFQRISQKNREKAYLRG
jgi:hypothetical protein